MLHESQNGQICRSCSERERACFGWQMEAKAVGRGSVTPPHPQGFGRILQRNPSLSVRLPAQNKAWHGMALHHPVELCLRSWSLDQPQGGATHSRWIRVSSSPLARPSGEGETCSHLEMLSEGLSWAAPALLQPHPDPFAAAVPGRLA